MKKCIEFSEPRKSDSGKTQIWKVYFDEVLLGQVKWFGRWRKYAFYPLAFTLYEQDCLRNIADFCEKESKKLRQQWRERAEEQQ